MSTDSSSSRDGRDRSSLFLVVVLVVIVLLVLYVGAYYWTIRPSRSTGAVGLVEWYRIAWKPNEDWKYQEIARRVFRPMVWLDHRIRTEVWYPTK